VGLLMLAVSWVAAWRLYRTRRDGGEIGVWPLRALVLMTPAGWVATLAGWYVTEIGRQPWLVTGVLSTGEAAGPVGATVILGSLTAYLAVYVGLLAAYVSVVLYLTRKAAGTPGDGMADGGREAGHPAAAFVPAE
ncbi:MAG: cytochrome ubiquinol oxidase subunit I, partial [Pseudomonadota bacterium]